MNIFGIDLAWGASMPDGVCWLTVDGPKAEAREVALLRGDDALLDWLAARSHDEPTVIALDAPVICPNPTGARPVDRLSHVHFGRFHAGCHPANQRLAARPLRVVERLVRLGFVPGWDLTAVPRLITEVFPHPATVRWFGLDRIIKYKRGPVAERRCEFARLQTLLRACLGRCFPALLLPAEVHSLLVAPWSKPVEDQLDAFICALVGLQHWRQAGAETEVLGDLQTGFFIVPREGRAPELKRSGDLNENRVAGRRDR